MRKRKLTPEDEATIDTLRSKLILTLRFVEEVEDFPSGPQVRTIVDDAARRGDLRSLKVIERDIDEAILGLTDHRRQRLNTLLEQQLGVNNEIARKERRNEVAAILARDSIAGEKERRRLEEYLEMLEITHQDSAEIVSVRRLLQK